MPYSADLFGNIVIFVPFIVDAVDVGDPLFDCLIKGLLLLLFACVELLLLLSVTDLVGGCGGGPRCLVFVSPALDAAVVVFVAGFICFFIIKCRESSVLKSTAVPLFKLLVVLVFCGLFPADDADDGDSFVVGDVTPIDRPPTGFNFGIADIPSKIPFSFGVPFICALFPLFGGGGRDGAPPPPLPPPFDLKLLLFML